MLTQFSPYIPHLIAAAFPAVTAFVLLIRQERLTERLSQRIAAALTRSHTKSPNATVRHMQRLLNGEGDHGN